MLLIPRLLCVLTPNLPVQVERKRHEATLPLVITNPIEGNTVYAASVEAVRSGVQVGMALHEARQMAPAAKIIQPAEEEYHQEHNAIQKAVKAFSPKLETHALGEFLFDMRGLGAIHGGESKLAQALLEGVRSVTNLAVQIGIGAGKFVAQTAARFAPLNTAKVVPQGSEADFVAPLSINRLPGLPREIKRRLTMFDIQTMGQLSALRKAAVLRQFGSEVSPFYELARGHDLSPLLVDIPPLRVVRARNLDEPVTDRRVLMTLVTRLSQQVSRTLRTHGYHTEALKLVIEGGHRSEPFRLEMGYVLKPPTEAEAKLAGLALLLLNRLVIPSAVTRVSLCAYPLRAWYFGAQQMVLEDATASQKFVQVEETRQLLIHRFGQSSLQPASMIGQPSPVPVDVRVNRHNWPISVIIAGQRYRVQGVDDHWRDDRNWWDTPFRRDYFRVFLTDNSLRNIFLDLSNGQWYIDRAWPVL